MKFGQDPQNGQEVEQGGHRAKVIPLATRQTPTEWMVLFQGALATRQDPERLGSKLDEGIKKRAWASLSDPQGRSFTSFDHFAATPQPHGLGCDPQEARKFVENLVGKRAADLMLVDPPTQGFRSDKHTDIESGSSRKAERLRAIERAPKVIQDLYVRELLTITEACKFGRKEKSRALQDAENAFCKKHHDTLKTQTPENHGSLRKAVKEDVADIFNDVDPKPVMALIRGDNADLMLEATALHLKEGAKVADVTYGEGRFWKKIPEGLFQLLDSDIAQDRSSRPGTDARALPHDPKSLDAVFLDPPYKEHREGGYNDVIGKKYNTYHSSYEDILTLYRECMTEALRVLRSKGLLFVKCQAQLSGGRQCWMDYDIHGIASGLGLELVDRFILNPTAVKMSNPNKKPHHALKNYSMLLVFRLPGATTKQGASGVRVSGERLEECENAPAELPGVPPVKDRLIHVLKENGPLRIAEILKEFEKHEGWMPESKDPNTYMSYVLGDKKNKVMFERVGHGQYRLVDTDPKTLKSEEKSQT